MVFLKKNKPDVSTIDDYLRDIPYFASLSSKELAELAHVSRLTQKESGEFIVRAGDDATHYFVLLQGMVVMYFLKPNGKRFVVQTFSKGALFFVSHALAQSRYNGFIEVIDDAQFISIPARHTMNLLKSNSDFVQSMLRYALNDNLRLTDTISGFLIDARARLGRFMFRRALETGERVDGKLCFDLGIPKSEIAAALDLSPETLSRTFAQLKNEDVISMDDSIVTIKNVRKLVQISENL